MIEIGEKFGGVEGCGAEVRGLVRGISLPSGGRVWARGLWPLPRNFF